MDFSDLDPLAARPAASTAAATSPAPTGSSSGSSGLPTGTSSAGGVGGGVPLPQVATAVSGGVSVFTQAAVGTIARCLREHRGRDSAHVRSHILSSYLRDPLESARAGGKGTSVAYVSCAQFRELLDALPSEEGTGFEEDERIVALRMCIRNITDVEKKYSALLKGRSNDEVFRIREVLMKNEKEFQERKKKAKEAAKLAKNAKKKGGSTATSSGNSKEPVGDLIDTAGWDNDTTATTGAAGTAGYPVGVASSTASGDVGAVPGVPPMDVNNNVSAFYPVASNLYDELKNHLRTSEFGDKRRVLHTAARAHYFTAAQLRGLLDVLDFAEDRIIAVQMISPKVLDRSAFFAAVASKVTESSERAKIDEAWEQSRGPALPAGVTGESVVAAAEAGRIVDLTAQGGGSESKSAADPISFADTLLGARHRTDSSISVEDAFGITPSRTASGYPASNVAVAGSDVGSVDSLLFGDTTSAASVKGNSNVIGGGGGGGGGEGGAAGSSSLLEAPSGMGNYDALRDRSMSTPIMTIQPTPSSSSPFINVATGDIDSAKAMGGGIGSGCEFDSGGGRSRVTSHAGTSANSMHSPIDQRALDDLLGTLQRAGFEDKTPHLRQAAMFNFFTCSQLSKVMSVLDFGNEREAAARLLGPRLIDPEMSFEVVSRISDDQDRAKVAQILSKASSTL